MNLMEKINDFFEQINDEINTGDDLSELIATTGINLAIVASGYELNELEVENISSALKDSFKETFYTFRQMRSPIN